MSVKKQNISNVAMIFALSKLPKLQILKLTFTRYPLSLPLCTATLLCSSNVHIGRPISPKTCTHRHQANKVSMQKYVTNYQMYLDCINKALRRHVQTGNTTHTSNVKGRNLCKMKNAVNCKTIPALTHLLQYEHYSNF